MSLRVSLPCGKKKKKKLKDRNEKEEESSPWCLLSKNAAKFSSKMKRHVDRENGRTDQVPSFRC